MEEAYREFLKYDFNHNDKWLKYFDGLEPRP